MNFLRFTEEVEALEENGGASGQPCQLQEKIYEKPVRFWRIVLLNHCAHVYTRQSTSDVPTQSGNSVALQGLHVSLTLK